MLPQGSVPAPDPEPEPPADIQTQVPEEYLPVQRYRRRSSLRIRILLFAVLGGGLLTAILSFLASVLILAVEPAVFNREPRSLPLLFVQYCASMGPMLILVAAIAAAADALIKRSAHASQQAADDLTRALRRLTRTRDGREERPISRELDLEIDSRAERP